MTSWMEKIDAAPADALLGLMLAARADERPQKVDLSVGIYKDELGTTPVLRAVKEAERHLLESQSTKAYESPMGNPLFCQAIANLVLGEQGDRHALFATPGGSGALFVGMRLAQALNPRARMFLSNPSWPNHMGIAKSLGIETVFFPYEAQADGTPDFGKIVAGLEAAEAGAILLLQGACHNPTGTDLSADQWAELADLVTQRGLIPFVDIAYQGFKIGLEEDVTPVRAFLQAVPEAIVSYSCSKNFGLYRERTGALIIQAPSSGTLENVRSQAASMVRASYSMPPAHGAAIVATIFGDEALRALWQDELNSMRERLTQLREGFAAALVRATNNGSFEALAHQAGMFSILPFRQGGLIDLQKDEGVYIPGSGRTNIAGLPGDRLDEVAMRIAPYLSLEN